MRLRLSVARRVRRLGLPLRNEKGRLSLSLSLFRLASRDIRLNLIARIIGNNDGVEVNPNRSVNGPVKREKEVNGIVSADRARYIHKRPAKGRA